MRTVLFDVDGVLIHGYHAKPELRKYWDVNIAADLGISRERFRNEFILGPFINEVIVGQRDLKDALSEILPRIGYTADPQIVIDYWLRTDSNLNGELIEQVKRIRRSGAARLCVATNQEHHRARYLMSELKLSEYFDDMYHSARIGAQKPHVAYFERVSALLGEQTAPPILFDDTPAVVEAANASGWEAYEYTNVFDLHRCEFVRTLLAS